MRESLAGGEGRPGRVDEARATHAGGHVAEDWPDAPARRHAAGALGCPILGDARYNPKHSPEDDVDGLFLRAVEVTLPPSATPWRFGDGTRRTTAIEPSTFA